MTSSVITLGNIDKCVNIGELEKCYLQSRNGKISIPVDPKKVSECESLRLRCKVTDNVGYVIIDEDDPYIICDLGIALGHKSRKDKMDDTLLFTYSLADSRLEELVHYTYNDYTITSETFVLSYDDENRKRIDDIDKHENDSPVQLEPTNELFEYSPEYLLSSHNKMRAAFSHPYLYKCDNELLHYASIELYNQEILFAMNGTGQITFFTNEYENLPVIAQHKGYSYPLRLYSHTNNTLIESEEMHNRGNKPLSYQQMKRELNVHINRNSNKVIKSLLQSDYCVIVGNWVSSKFHNEQYSNNKIICAKSKEFVPLILSAFKDHKIISETPNEITFEYICDEYKLVIPQVDYKHYTACQPYSINRCYTDGNDIYMTLSCMATLVGEIMYVRGKFTTASETINMLDCGYAFYLKDIPNEQYDTISQRTKLRETNIISDSGDSRTESHEISMGLYDILHRYT